MTTHDLEESQLVLCTVEKIIGTTVFVKIDSYNLEGTITTSEIAPGRIRNLRDYVVPNKKIVCKVLSIRENSIHLSLRRVKPNERKELLDKIEKENSYKAIIRTVIGKEKAEDLIKNITEEETISEFFEKLKQGSKDMGKYLNKEESEKILKILESKKEKPKEIRQIFKLSSKSSAGINLIKTIIQDSCSKTNCSVTYLAAGKFSLSIRGEDFKEINNESQKVLNSIESKAKKDHCDFSIEKN
jgi:translation initiation factor 2 alpha subunit (eIF-2alpha)